MLKYLFKNGQKAYREINSIITNPEFLFSTDPTLVIMEHRHNLHYIYGLNRLLKNNRITNNLVVDIWLFLERNIEQYLKKHYVNKSFVLYICADPLIPAFTLSVVSYFEETQLKSCVSLEELIIWFKEHAYFNGIMIEPEQITPYEAQDDEIDQTPDSKRYYSRLIET